MKTVISRADGDDDREGDNEPESCDAADHREEEEIIKNRRFDAHDLDTFPDLTTARPGESDDFMKRRAEHENKTLTTGCLFGLARVHMPVWAIIGHGERGANGTVRYAAWDGRDYDVSAKPVDENGMPLRRNEPGVHSYRDLAAQYGVARCTIERAYEHFVDAVLPYARNGAYDRLSRVLWDHMTHDLGGSPDPVGRCDWLERLSWSLGDLNEVLLRRCPTKQAGRDPVRALACRLVQEGMVVPSLAKSFRMPSYQTREQLAGEYADVETVVGRDSLNRIMAMLADSLAKTGSVFERCCQGMTHRDQ